MILFENTVVQKAVKDTHTMIPSPSLPSSFPPSLHQLLFSHGMLRPFMLFTNSYWASGTVLSAGYKTSNKVLLCYSGGVRQYCKQNKIVMLL